MLQNPFVPTEGQMAYILEISKSNNKLWQNLISVVEAIRNICMIKQSQKRTIKAGR